MVSIAEFNLNDPYPNIAVGECSYREAQVHAYDVDTWLGLKTIEIEATLEDQGTSQELWIGLPPQSLLTPYIEFRQILELLHLNRGDTIIDCGAAYGRMGFVIGAHYPGVNFIGYEMVRERVEEGTRCLKSQNYNSAHLICANMDDDDFVLPEASVYFVYDFSHRQAIDRLLQRIQMIAQRRPVVVVARGRSSRDAIDHGTPWLSQVVPPQHYQNFSIYRSA